MRKIKLGIDVDEVLCLTNDFFLKDFNLKHGTNIKKEDLTNYKFSNFTEFSQEYIFKELMKHIEENLENYDLIDGAKEVILKLKEKYELYIITSRWLKFKEKTISWLNKFFGEDFFEEILIYNDRDESICKIDMAEKYGIEILIEDAPHFIENGNKRGIKVLIMDRPWNRQINESENLIRVYSWKDIEKKLL